MSDHDEHGGEGTGPAPGEDRWFTRSVLFVTDMQVALAHYVGLLGFEEAWRYEEAGAVLVCEVGRGDCRVILNVNPERAGKSRLFVALWPQEMTTLLEEIESKSIPTSRDFWGYDVLRIDDPDGNEIMIPVET